MFLTQKFGPTARLGEPMPQELAPSVFAVPLHSGATLSVTVTAERLVVKSDDSRFEDALLDRLLPLRNREVPPLAPADFALGHALNTIFR